MAIRKGFAGSAGAALLLAGCATAPVPPTRPASAPRPAASPAPRSDDAVLGRTARELEAAFGAPAAQLVEGPARRLQYSGPVCVLDAYLYPRDRGDPAVTHVDTRRPTGEDIDRASCVAALRKR